MAVTLETLLLELGLSSEPLQKGLASARSGLGGFAGNAGALLGGAVVGGATLAVGAIVGIGTAAFDVSRQTDSAAADMAAALGIPREEAERFAEVARRVYGNSFAENVGDAADAVTELARQLNLSADDPSLQRLTENAFRLRDTFDVEVSESVSAAKTLMDNFGLSGDDAFNMIAAGYQKGLDRSGDFLDTINEYSVQFAGADATASQFFSLLESGLQGGALGTDKAADAFKEFTLRIVDGSKTTTDALTQLFPPEFAEELLGGLRDGTYSVAQAFEDVVYGLDSTADPLLRNQLGVALLGTQFEDLTDQVVLNLDMTEDWAAKSAGAIDSIDQKYTTFGQVTGAMWRRLLTTVSPFTDELLDIANDAVPVVMDAFDRFDATVPPTLERARTVITTVVTFLQGLFSGFGQSTDDNLTGPMVYWNNWVKENLPRIQQIIQAALSAIQAFWAQWGDTILYVVNNTLGVIVTIIGTVMATIGDIITLALQLITGDWDGAYVTIIGIVQRLFDTLVTVFTTQLDSLRAIFGNIDWAAAGQAIIDSIRNGLSAAWNGLESWWRGRLQTLSNLLPFSEPKDPSSPLRGLGRSGASMVKMFRGGAEGELARLRDAMSNGLDSLFGAGGGLGGLQPATATAGGNMTFGDINVYLASGGYEEGRAAARGILDELRARGAK